MQIQSNGSKFVNCTFFLWTLIFIRLSLRDHWKGLPNSSSASSCLIVIVFAIMLHQNILWVFEVFISFHKKRTLMYLVEGRYIEEKLQIFACCFVCIKLPQTLHLREIKFKIWFANNSHKFLLKLCHEFVNVFLFACVCFLSRF